MPGSILAGLRIAFVGSTAVGTTEALLAAWDTARRLHGGTLPADLIAAAIGRAVVTHALVWLPLLAACGASFFVITRRRAGSSPERVLSAVFVAIVGLVVVPADLDLARLGGRAVFAAACCAVFACAAATYLLMGVIQGRWGLLGLRRFLNVTAFI